MFDPNLKYFHEAVQLGSMRAAAEKLGVAVSTISRQIAQVESDLGVVLIEHGRRRVKVTEAGSLMLEYYREQLAQKESFESRLDDLKGLRAGRVDIAIGEGFVSKMLSDVFSKFIDGHPGIKLEVRVAPSSIEVARMVVEDEVHLGLVFHVAPDPKIYARVTARQPLKAIMRPDHPLAKRSYLNLKDLAQRRICLPEASLRIRQLLRIAEANEGVVLDPHLMTNSVGLIVDVLQAGDWITLLPEMVMHQEIKHGHLMAVPVRNAMLQETTINLITRVGRRLATAPGLLLATLERHLKSLARPRKSASER